MSKKKQTKKVARKVVRKKPTLKESMDKACDIPLPCGETACDPVLSEYQQGYRNGKHCAEANSLETQIKLCVAERQEIDDQLTSFDIRIDELRASRRRVDQRLEKLHRKLDAPLAQGDNPF